MTDPIVPGEKPGTAGPAFKEPFLHFTYTVDM
jgi:hypothetical protein